MAAKDKLIGIIIILLGALPLLVKIEAINNLIGKYEIILPGGYIYQVVLVILGLLLLIAVRHKIHLEPRRY